MRGSSRLKDLLSSLLRHQQRSGKGLLSADIRTRTDGIKRQASSNFTAIKRNQGGTFRNPRTKFGGYPAARYREQKRFEIESSLPARRAIGYRSCGLAGIPLDAANAGHHHDSADDAVDARDAPHPEQPPAGSAL